MSFTNPVQTQGIAAPGAPGQNNLLGLLGNLAGGAGAFVQEHDAVKQRKFDNKLAEGQNDRANAELQMTQQKATKESAAANFQQAYAVWQGHPERRTDPVLTKYLQDNAQAAGMYLPMTQDGHIDGSALMPDISTMPEDEQIRAAALPPGPQRDAIYNKYSGVSPELRRAPAYIDAKAQLGIDKLRLATQHDAEWNLTQQTRTKNMQTRTQIYASGTAEQISRAKTDEALINSRARAIPEMVNIAQQRVGLEQQRINNALTNFQSVHDPKSLTALTAASSSAFRAVTQAQSDLDRATATYQAALDGGADEDSLGAAKTALDAAKQTVDDTRDLRDQAISAMSANVGVASNLSAASGSKVTIQPKNTDPKLMKVGTVVNGYIKRADGKWYKNG